MVSKLNNDRKAGEGAGQAIGRIYGKIGFGGLWNGLPVRIFMIGTLTAFQWLIYDSFKVYLGVSFFFIYITQVVVLTLLATHHWRSLIALILRVTYSCECVWRSGAYLGIINFYHFIVLCSPNARPHSPIHYHSSNACSPRLSAFELLSGLPLTTSSTRRYYQSSCLPCKAVYQVLRQMIKDS
jgi:hypothetical protein